MNIPKKAQEKIGEVMHEFIEDKLENLAKKMINRKQAIATGISEADPKGLKVPKRD